MKARTIVLLSLIGVAVIAAIITVPIVVVQRNNDSNSTGGGNSSGSGSSSSSSSSSGTDSVFLGSKEIPLDVDDVDGTVPTKVWLVKSTPQTLLTLVLMSADNRSFHPIGRSYNGNDWEPSAGAYAGTITFHCNDDDGEADNGNGSDQEILVYGPNGEQDGSSSTLSYSSSSSSSCSVTLPVIPSDKVGSRYELSTYNAPAYSQKDIAARFFEQTTFGPTRRDIDTLLNDFLTTSTNNNDEGNDLDGTTFSRSSSSSLDLAMARWIQHQQVDVPVSSHRAFFRRHLNARYPIPSPIGPVTTPCMAGSRYRLHSFSVKDTERVVTIKTLRTDSAGEPTKRALLLDGQPRTVVGGTMYVLDEEENIEQMTWEDGDYLVCFVVEVFDEGSPISILVLDQTGSGDCQIVIFQMSDNDAVDFQSNPYVQFSADDLTMLEEASIPLPVTRDVEFGDASPIDVLLTKDYDPEEQYIIIETPLEDCPDNRPSDEIPLFVRWSDRLYIHDPRFILLENDINAPLEDGGGKVAAEFTNPYRPSFSTLCSNVPRTFLNEENCYMSDSPSACTYNFDTEEEDRPGSLQEALFEVSHQSLRAIFDATGGGGPGTAYLYAIEGLDIERDPESAPPCEPGAISRWVPVTCSADRPTVSLATDRLLANIIQRFNEENENPNFVDIFHPLNLQFSCADDDTSAVGFEVNDLEDNTLCWKNVHADNMKIFDFTSWTIGHPGNSDARNPITEVAMVGNTTLNFPVWHVMSRWNNNKVGFGGGYVSLGDTINFYDLPETLISEELADALNLTLTLDGGSVTDTTEDQQRGLTVVCGSPFESANEPSLGGSQGQGAFDAFTLLYQTTFEPLTAQRSTIWTNVVLNDPGQLRQRMAWALSQVFVISPSGISESQFVTEAFVNYYDIFVRNAFGNFRDILREIAFSPMMADMLTYHGSRSTASVWSEEREVQYPDENFAREVMQLFSVGLVPLNLDGTPRSSKETVYNNDDIEEYSRAWTGFVQQSRRGNIEGVEQNKVDPLRIVNEWRDRLPKMGLDGKYIGDGVPLCSDLPDKPYFVKGAKYRALGRTPRPEVHSYPSMWNNPENEVQHLTLEVTSELYGKLCNPSATGSCQFPTTIELEDTIDCNGQECEVDMIQVVKVNTVFYEYIPVVCVHQAFFENAKTLVRKDGESAICGDPRMLAGSVVCCSDNQVASWADVYWGERTKFASMGDRCDSFGSICSPNQYKVCDEEPQCSDNGFYWTTSGCQLQIKINSEMKVAIVHEPSISLSDVDSAVDQDTAQTYFRVDWRGEMGDLFSNCNSIDACNLGSDGSCVCDVSVQDEQVFSSEVPSINEIKSRLHIGGIVLQEDPEITSGTVNVYDVDVDGSFTSSTIFQFADEFGNMIERKNVQSVVQIDGTTIQFRNPPHFISLAAGQLYEARYETEAVLDSYNYHSNTAPFISSRLIQRFGISNPSPRFVRAVAIAFQSGIFTYTGDDSVLSFGSGEYGDLAATSAAILLDDESRSIVLDADPTHGAFKEPLLKVTGIMRSMEIDLHSWVPWVEFSRELSDTTGQASHEAPSVFSFFLPEYQPPGRVAQASLVAPESQILTAPRIIDTFNGFFSMMKYGYTHCLGGFAPQDLFERSSLPCRNIAFGDTSNSQGYLSYKPRGESSTPASTIDEIASLMTAGRLNQRSREIITDAYTDEVDPDRAVIKAQLLTALSPEFHVTNVIRPSDQLRPTKPPLPPPSKPYKAIINIQLQGGVDSFNLLAPHVCSTLNQNGLTVLDQYNNERTTLAFTDEERTRIIDASSQPCDQFAIHPNLPVVEKMYNDGTLAFLANIGQLDSPVSKETYITDTRTELFAHNTMQRISQRIDPFDASLGTGILGRMGDALRKLGFVAQPITISEASVAAVGEPSSSGESSSPLVVSSRGLSQFAPNGRNDSFNIREYLPLLNNVTHLRSSIFGETWSDLVQTAVENSESLSEAISNVQLTQDYPSNGGPYIGKIQALSSLILTHKERGTDRDLFWLNLGDWDHHENLKPNLASEFDQLDAALTLLEQELKAQDYFDNVTVVITSDFARTLTANSGTGSDHAWGGNVFAFGGSVKGGQILGEYPSDITMSGPLNVGRGRLIPTLSWESLFNPIAEWMGIIDPIDLDYCMPNRLQTGTELFSQTDLFNK